jgi:hypothetical protein
VWSVVEPVLSPTRGRLAIVYCTYMTKQIET